MSEEHPIAVVNVSVEVSRKRLYELVTTGIESGQYSSFRVMGPYATALGKAGYAANAYGDREQPPEADAFAELRLYDRYAEEEYDWYHDGNPGNLKQEPPKPTHQLLTDAALCIGLNTLARKAPHLLAQFLDENEDAITGDAFLQCVVLGGVIYG